MKIGLTQRVLHHNNQAYDCVEHGFYRFLNGHTLFYIPNTLDQDLCAVAQGIDLLIITGGDSHPVRDLIEHKLIYFMQMAGKPIIGICHGSHLLVNYFGGKCFDISGHHNVEHYIVYRDNRFKVNSYHSLAIQQLPVNAVTLATSEEGDCEAWIMDKIAGVVWHPERMDEPWLPDEIQSLLNETCNIQNQPSGKSENSL